jgi:hypothetical protein
LSGGEETTCETYVGDKWEDSVTIDIKEIGCNIVD